MPKSKYPQLSPALCRKIKAAPASEEFQSLMIKSLLEMWNARTPHFGGSGPHRYDGISKECSYCLRPKNWKPVNAGFWSSEILYGTACEPKKKKAA